jgi:hypothetical protein
MMNVKKYYVIINQLRIYVGVRTVQILIFSLPPYFNQGLFRPQAFNRVDYSRFNRLEADGS